jgi:hypothetical protein
MSSASSIEACWFKQYVGTGTTKMQEMLKRPLYSSSSSLQADSFSITATDMNLSLALLQKNLYAPQLGACYGSRM